MPKQRFVWTFLALLYAALFYLCIFKTLPSPSTIAANRGLIQRQQESAAAVRTKFSARDIVNKAYNETFIHLESSPCRKNETIKRCLTNMEKQGHKKWPWWFQTMLRDSSKGNGLHGGWHNLRIAEPSLKLCVIEKIGTKQFRKLQCLLNTGQMSRKLCQPPPPPPGKNNQTRPAGDESHFKTVVFTRDPLERFLSAFIDKCIRPGHRLKEKHCEPNLVYGPPTENNTNQPLLDVFLKDPQRFFEAYVDTFPLKWNLHFFPQSLYCDGLYRHIEDYDFVGHMGPRFYDDLYDFGQTFAEGTSSRRLPQVVDQIFHVTKHRNQSQENMGVETSAASHVEEYYTPRTVKRVLEYMSIDYVKLNLPIPEWAEKMLQQDDDTSMM